jgi:hypothetical protein
MWAGRTACKEISFLPRLLIDAGPCLRLGAGAVVDGSGAPPMHPLSEDSSDPYPPSKSIAN